MLAQAAPTTRHQSRHSMVFRAAVVVALLLAATVAYSADGVVVLYLQPLPQDAARLTFNVASVSAVADSGVEYPLDVHVKTISTAAAGRQRLLASGRVPAGSYARLSVKVRQASLKSERGAVSLASSDAPVSIPLSFAVSAQRTALFWLLFKYEGSISDGYAFNPLLDAIRPGKPVTGRAAFVANAGSNTVTVVDKTAAQAVGVIDTCGRPSGMALDQRRRRLYVVCSGSDEIEAIDIASEEVLERAPLSPGDAPREAALTPDGSTLVTVNARSNSITFFGVSPLTRLDRVAVGSGPGSIALDPAGARAFVFNTLASSISVVDVARRTVVATVATDAAPVRGQFSARGDRLFVVHERSPYLTVIDPVRLTTVTRTRLTAGIDCLKVDNRRDLLYAGGLRDTLIEFYNPSALVTVGAIDISGGASYLTIDAEEDRLYVVSPEARRVVIGSLAERKVLSVIDVGEAPSWVSVMGEK